jgi:hypothetical protein
MTTETHAAHEPLGCYSSERTIVGIASTAHILAVSLLLHMGMLVIAAAAVKDR